MNKKNIITWAVLFLLFFLTTQYFFKKQATPETANGEVPPIVISLSSTDFVTGGDVGVKIRNNTKDIVTIPSNCPSNPLVVLKWTSEKFEPITKQSPIDCKLSPDIVLQPEKEQDVNYSYWNNALFGEVGRYKIQFETTESPEFTITEAGFLRKIFRTIFYQPIYNVLVFLISIAPFSDLGLAIILLTLVIRLILLIPSQRAIVSQRRMQELQPKLEEVKKKYSGNQERVAQETMALWKQHKVNPFGSCLPTLIQFPVLIALYYVIRSGLNPDNAFMVYAPLKNIDLLHLHTMFLGILELTVPNKFVLPLVIGLLQFFQMRLAIKKSPKKDSPAKESEMETASRTMMYIMPVMIAMFTASVPAGVGLYWGISTTFGIVQQVIANQNVAAKAEHSAAA